MIDRSTPQGMARLPRLAPEHAAEHIVYRCVNRYTLGDDPQPSDFARVQDAINALLRCLDCGFAFTRIWPEIRGSLYGVHISEPRSITFGPAREDRS